MEHMVAPVATEEPQMAPKPLLVPEPERPERRLVVEVIYL
jgi:hypothetical protein